MRKIELDVGDPGPPGVEPASELSDILCHTVQSQKLVETHLMESSKQQSQELHQSKDCGKSEVDTSSELKEEVKLSERTEREGTDINIGPNSIEDSNLNSGNRCMWEEEVEQLNSHRTEKKAK